MSGLGHNNGPTMKTGIGWQKHCWTKARRDLLPQLPLEVIRWRVNRAREIGLDYKTYATVRATTGHDIVAFLFSSNALRLQRSAADLPKDRAVRLRDIERCGRLIAAAKPLTPETLADDFDALHAIRIDGALPAPLFTSSWSATRKQLRSALATHKLPASGVMLIGETAIEREWSAAASLAGYQIGQNYFTGASA